MTYNDIQMPKSSGLDNTTMIAVSLLVHYNVCIILLFDVSVDVSQTPSGDRFSLQVRESMKNRYELVSREGVYWVYLPKTNP